MSTPRGDDENLRPFQRGVPSPSSQGQCVLNASRGTAKVNYTALSNRRFYSRVFRPLGKLQIQINQTDAGLFEASVIAYYFQFVKHESNLCRVFKDHYDLQLSQCHSKGL